MLFGQEMKSKLRILVLTSSNAAVDIIARRMLHIRDKMESGELRFKDHIQCSRVSKSNFKTNLISIFSRKEKDDDTCAIWCFKQYASRCSSD